MRHRILNPGYVSQRRPSYRRILPSFRVSVAAALFLALVLPWTIQAAEGERPAWLRPLDEKSKTETGTGNQAAKEKSGNWGGWSKLEPGVLDVQAWDWLQQDLNRMLDRTTEAPPNHLAAEAFEENYLRATIKYLDVSNKAGETFETAVAKALGELVGARDEMLRQAPEREAGVDETAALLQSRAHWKEYRKAQSEAAQHPLALLQELPRHELLREVMLKWLLRLEYGIAAAAR